jgi:hypothetical protein
MRFNDYISNNNVNNKFKAFFIIGENINTNYNITNVNGIKIINNNTSINAISNYLNLSSSIIVDSINDSKNVIKNRISILRKIGYDVNAFYINEKIDNLKFDDYVIIKNKNNVIDNNYIEKIHDRFSYLLNSKVINKTGLDIMSMMNESNHKYLTDKYYDKDTLKKITNDFMRKDNVI